LILTISADKAPSEPRHAPGARLGDPRSPDRASGPGSGSAERPRSEHYTLNIRNYRISRFRASRAVGRAPGQLVPLSPRRPAPGRLNESKQPRAHAQTKTTNR